jgi:hypothetical protein
MTRLKGVYRRAWLENQLSLQKVIPFIQQLRDIGISVLLLDDLASILRLYDGLGARQLYSLDILVKPSDIPNLLDFLIEQKIWPKVSFGERYLMVETPLEVWSPFDLPLTIAWRESPCVKTLQQAVAAWNSAIPAVLGDCPVFTLDLESHFLRLCLRAIGTDPEASFFALVDVAWILSMQEGRVDWERVVDLARLNHQVLPMVKCLKEITTILEMPKANELLGQLRELPVSWMDRLEYRWVDAYHPFPGFFTQIGRRLLLYRRSPKVAGLLGFFLYLQYTWGGRRLLSLPRLAWKHFWNGLTRKGRM